MLERVKTPQKARARRELEKRAPKLIESGKKTLILHGMKTNAVLNAVLSDIYHLKKESAVKFSLRNKDICPFENGGETSLEFFSHQTDCSCEAKLKKEEKEGTEHASKRQKEDAE